ncbi:MAG: hypothetical protein ACYTGL_04350 [Planctomycetota bacterium]|jgi:hypothetical protein
MSSTLEQPPAATNEFTYRPTPPSATVALITGLLSLIALLTPLALPVTVIGVMIALLALRTIRSASGELSGKLIAQAGLVLCVVSLAAGTSWHSYAYATEVPEGYRRISFVRDIAKKGFVHRDGVDAYHDDVKALDGQKVFIKGYMYPDGRIEGIRNFIFCKDSGDCCFGGSPALTDMIEVVVAENAQPATFTTGLVSVAGTLKLRDLRRAGDLNPTYEIVADLVGLSKSMY